LCHNTTLYSESVLKTEVNLSFFYLADRSKC
jgi:hypothetical protein